MPPLILIDEGETSPIVPNDETQELYNEWKDEERKYATLDDHLRLHSEPHNLPYARPVTPSQASTVSRTPSGRTARSITEDLGHIGLDDSSNAPRRQRAKRNGPLRKPVKARAAFMRKLGACKPCRDRRVKCSHLNLSLFEQRYEAHIQSQSQSQERLQPPNYESFVDRQGSGLNDGTELIGTGTANLLEETTLFGHAGAEEDFQLLMQESRTEAEPGYPPSHESSAPLYNFVSATRPPLGAFTPALDDRFVPDEALLPEDALLPVGRELLSHAGSKWVCTWPYEASVAGEYSPLDEACNQQFSRASEVASHFSVHHREFRAGKYMMRCIPCSLVWDTTSKHERCVQCGVQPPQWERWYYGYFASIPSLTSGPSIRVDSQDAFGINPNSRQSRLPYAGSNDSLSCASPWPGYAGGGNYQQYQAAFAGPGTLAKLRSAYLPLSLQKSRGTYARDHSREKKSAKACNPRGYAASVTSDGVDGALTSRFGSPIIPCLLVLWFLYMAWVDNRSLSDGVALTPKKAVSLLLNFISDHLPRVYLACIIATILGMWLFRHIRYRTSLNHEESQRCVVARDILGISRGDEELGPLQRGYEPALAN